VTDTKEDEHDKVADWGFVIGAKELWLIDLLCGTEEPNSQMSRHKRMTHYKKGLAGHLTWIWIWWHTWYLRLGWYWVKDLIRFTEEFIVWMICDVKIYREVNDNEAE
jgi:hypothetical protein